MISLTESKASRILGIFFIAFAVVLLILIIPTQIQHVPGASPSPRFFPRILAVLLGALGTSLLVTGIKDKDKPDQAVVVSLDAKEAKLVALTIGVLMLYTVLLYFLPYIPATVLALGVLITSYGQKSVRKIVLTSILLPVIIYFSFTYLLMLKLP